MTAADTRTEVTIAFADITGSTALYASHGDHVGFDVTARCLQLVVAEVARFGGRVVKSLGDGLLTVFGTPEAAVRAAIAVEHAALRVDPDALVAPVQVRFGISRGLALVGADGDVHGDVVNLAARLVARAHRDEILLSERVYEALPDELRAAVRSIDELTMRKRPGTVGVYEYVWQHGESTVRFAPTECASGIGLELVAGDRTVLVDAAHPKVTIGRAADADLAIDDAAASRHHAEVALHGDKVVLADWSTNGTWVYPAGAESVRLLREEMVLVGSGTLRPGSASGPELRYRVVQR